MSGWLFVRKYSCPYRTKHRVRFQRADGGYIVSEVYYCTVKHEKCDQDPRRCPLRRELEGKQAGYLTLDEWWEDEC